MMPASRLLKSCARPPVSWPTASIFWLAAAPLRPPSIRACVPRRGARVRRRDHGAHSRPAVAPKISVLVPNHLTIGAALVVNRHHTRQEGAKLPSAARSGNTISKGSPLATDACPTFQNFGKGIRIVDFLPVPSLHLGGRRSCIGVPSDYYTRRCEPSALAIQHRVGIESASERNCRSLSCNAASARFCSVTSCDTPVMRSGLPAAS